MRLVPRRGVRRRKSRRPGAVVGVWMFTCAGAPLLAGSRLGDAWGFSQLSVRLYDCTSGS